MTELKTKELTYSKQQTFDLLCSPSQSKQFAKRHVAPKLFNRWQAFDLAGREGLTCRRLWAAL